MTKDSNKSNLRDSFMFVELVRLFTIDRQCLPENAHDGETFRRICDDELIAEPVALRGLAITAVFAAARVPLIHPSIYRCLLSWRVPSLPTVEYCAGAVDRIRPLT